VTAADVARFDSASALVAYLGQRDASPAVCDTRAPSAHISQFDRYRADALVAGLEEGKIDPEIWQRCVAAALDSDASREVAAIVGAIGHGYRRLATDDTIETSPAVQARIAALQAAYIGRPAGKNGDPQDMTNAFEELRRRFIARRFGPVAARFVGELLGVVDLEQGRYGGRPVDDASIGEIAARSDANLLRRFADRLPSQDLRDQSRRGLIRVHIAASPFAEVRAQAAVVEERVFREGVNRVSLAAQPVARASFDNDKFPVRTVLARQNIQQQTVTLLGSAGGSELSVVPSLSLVGALWIDVAGVSRPITICQAASSFDPTPCVAGSDVTLENPTAAVDSRGSFQFRDRVTESELIAMTGTRGWFPLAIDVGGKRMVTLRWPLRFESPNALLLGGGPDLNVAIRRADPALFSFTVTDGGSRYQAIVEKSDLAAFRVVSVGNMGSDGSSGSDGFDGTPGMDGSSASCPMTSGSSGGNGGDGGNGGPGGNVQVEYDCGAATCSGDEVALLRKVVASEGGRGGSGGRPGRGGRGGRGGSGGRGTTCTDSKGGTSTLGGGSDGMSGMNGMDGSAGSSGRPGRPGRVTFRVIASPRS
jgi:hypothetical protein